MKLEHMIRILAGTMVLTSLVLSQMVSEWWLLLGAFVGINLIQSSFTRVCPAEKALSRIARR
jgi:hypothetical protein